MKIQTEEKIIESFYERKLLLQMSYYPESDNPFNNKSKVVLDLTNYAHKNNYTMLHMSILLD